jgi:hypothetical protein
MTAGMTTTSPSINYAMGVVAFVSLMGIIVCISWALLNRDTDKREQFGYPRLFKL